jgi:hypothetical protein
VPLLSQRSFPGGRSCMVDNKTPVHWPTNYTREAAEQAELAAGNISRFVREKLGCQE